LRYGEIFFAAMHLPFGGRVNLATKVIPMSEEGGVQIDVEEYVVGSIEVAVRAMFEIGKQQGLRFLEPDIRRVVEISETLKLAVRNAVANASARFIISSPPPN
jgi:hypothetical protein